VLPREVVVAINEKGASYNYNRQVSFQIERDNVDSYRKAASWINRSKIDLVNIQHEFGLFGGDWGDHIIAFLDELKRPVVTTLHTVLPNPHSKVREIMEKIARKSSSLVNMSLNAIRILKDNYHITKNVTNIPHGSPDIPFIHSDSQKTSLGLKDKVVLSTFGLMNRNKGLQHVIRALPSIITHHSNVIYLILGETHPEVRIMEGERYRKGLMKVVDDLDLDKHVRFHNRFLTQRELIRYLQATDIYVAPYVSRTQVSSGTLVYALVAGKAIVSTPFLHAQELLADNRGILCRFRSPASIAKSVITLLEDKDSTQKMRKKAYQYGRQLIWPRIAERYVKLFHEII
jgi:glycosyltransferase involved in cell wall biosynthesis